MFSSFLGARRQQPVRWWSDHISRVGIIQWNPTDHLQAAASAAAVAAVYGMRVVASQSTTSVYSDREAAASTATRAPQPPMRGSCADCATPWVVKSCDVTALSSNAKMPDTLRRRAQFHIQWRFGRMVD